MVQTIKAILLLDYDSLYRSLNRRKAGAGDQLGARAGAWLEAIESGEMLVPPQPETRHRLLAKRCYADPKVMGKNRGWLTANGVQITDSPTLPGHARSPVDIHLALDVLDALEEGADFEEVIILSAEADLTPLLFRLKAENRRTVVYASDGTAASYRALAERVISEEQLLEVLSRAPAREASIPRPEPVMPRREAGRAQPAAPVPAAPSAVPARTPGAIDREALATLVRRIHQATSVPLFSPKAFADFFRLLAAEVAENGYRFQSTAENVTARMNALGRAVTKRQVGFVVKGLALRGHVFSGTDTPEKLAETFYDQVLYLVENAKLALSDAEKGLVLAWIGGFRGRHIEAEPVVREIAPPAEAVRQPNEPEVQPRSQPERPRPAVARPVAPAAAEDRAAAAPPVSPEPRPVMREPLAQPQRTEPRLAPSAGPAGRAAAPQDRAGTAASPRRAAPPIAVEAAPDHLDRTEAAAPRPAMRRPLGESKREPLEAAEPAGPGAAPVRPAAPAATMRNGATRPTTKPAPEREKSDIEDSILAAIADAVDVLVEDRATDRPAQGREEIGPRAAAAPRPAPTAPTPSAVRPAPAPEPADRDGDADDIGDEIQRILASYSKNR